MADGSWSPSRGTDSRNVAREWDSNVEYIRGKRMRDFDSTSDIDDNIRSSSRPCSQQDFSDRSSEYGRAIGVPRPGFQNNQRDPYDVTTHRKSEKSQSSSSEFVSSISHDGKEVFKRVKNKVPLIQRSLAVVLASLQGVQVVIELKNDNEVTGTVDETDSNMNVTLYNVRQVTPSGKVSELEIMFLSGSKIRYVHIPEEYPIVKHLKLYTKTIQRVSVRLPRKIVDRKRKDDDDIPDF